MKKSTIYIFTDTYLQMKEGEQGRVRIPAGVDALHVREAKG